MGHDAGAKPLFKTAKRKKPFRRRRSSASDDGLSEAAPAGPSASLTLNTQPEGEEAGDSEDGDQGTGKIQGSPSAAMRRPRAFRPTRGGIAFTTRDVGQPTHALDEESGALVRLDENEAAVQAAMHRFAPQTGQVVDPNDRHMTAYVDAELARLRGSANSHSQPRDESHSPSSQIARPHSSSRKPIDSATHGKLQEVDLGPDAAARNVARTQAATRRLLGEVDMATDENFGEGSIAKDRLGRDGKPLRRKRQRRTSDEMRRDTLVDSILRENRIELYDDSPSAGVAGGNGVEATDERIAEQFKQDFMDAVQNRNRELANRKPPNSGTTSRGTGQNNEARGPKLGGSRSARAAMRAKEAAAQQQQRGR